MKTMWYLMIYSHYLTFHPPISSIRLRALKVQFEIASDFFEAS